MKRHQILLFRMSFIVKIMLRDPSTDALTNYLDKYFTALLVAIILIACQFLWWIW